MSLRLSHIIAKNIESNRIKKMTPDDNRPWLQNHSATSRGYSSLADMTTAPIGLCSKPDTGHGQEFSSWQQSEKFSCSLRRAQWTLQPAKRRRKRRRKPKLLEVNRFVLGTILSRLTNHREKGISPKLKKKPIKKKPEAHEFALEENPLYVVCSMLAYKFEDTWTQWNRLV